MPEHGEGQVGPVGETSWSRCKDRPQHGEGQALALRAHRGVRPQHGEGQALALRADWNSERSTARDRPSPYARMERFSDYSENTFAF